MKRRLCRAAAALTLGALAATAGQAQQKLRDIGKAEYQSSCAGCHGESARGDGPLKAYLNRAPTDLSTLAQRNGGVFPLQRVLELIDGRAAAEIGPHGPREMPIWGSVYRSRAAPAEGEFDPEWVARIKLAALADYLARIQAR
jgi:mono/diheme cytochrome c family protein